VNKDFFTKPISLKDIKLPQIDIKSIKNNKLILICIFIIVFFIVICIIGANLLSARSEAKDQNLIAERKYKALMAAPSKEVMQNETILLEEEANKYNEKISYIDGEEFSNLLKEFKAEAPIKWSEENVTVRLESNARDLKNYDIYRVNIKNFTGAIADIEEFLEYVKNYKKMVKIDSLKFNRIKLTGNLSGETTLSFYFAKS